ncbi:MAG: hypothetical protein LC808_34570, partial [Actinobacteria bacterium]|nr:hypothetical protein [Actinomycetota bacterium]
SRSDGVSGQPHPIFSPERATRQGERRLAPLIPEDQRFSRVYRGRGELIDHLLVSHVLVKAVTTVNTGQIEIPSITDQPSDRQDEAGSDHRPVVVRFELG